MRNLLQGPSIPRQPLYLADSPDVLGVVTRTPTSSDRWFQKAQLEIAPHGPVGQTYQFGKRMNIEAVGDGLSVNLFLCFQR